MSSFREALQQEAIDAESRRDEPPSRMHRARSTGQTSQVYTVRMPAGQLAELRAVAELSGEQPSTLMRRWVLERLAEERAHQPDLTDVRRTLADVLHTLDRISNQRPA